MELKQNEKDLTGWLMFFLAVYVGLGSFVSMLMDVIESVGSKSGLLVVLIALLSNIPFMIIAVATIRAFCLYKSNAVSLAKTYVLMRAMAAFMLLTMGFVEAQANTMYTAIGALIGCVIWFVYLHVSKQVKRMIPVETRQWKMLEKIMLIICATIVFLFTGLCCLGYIINQFSAQ